MYFLKRSLIYWSLSLNTGYKTLHLVSYFPIPLPLDIRKYKMKTENYN